MDLPGKKKRKEIFSEMDAWGVVLNMPQGGIG
jgi:hypothetical protein